MLAQFQSGQENTKVGFAFPAREKQSFRSLLPNSSDAIIDLIEKMLVYDPADRITAKDALEHAAFRELRRADVEWQKGSRNVPFSSWYSGDRPKIVSPCEDLVARPVVHVLSPAAASETLKLETEVPPPRSLLAIAPKPKPIVNPMESRRLAAQRAADYNKKHMLATDKFRIATKLPQVTAYQRPGPEMIQPRLAPMIFQPLKKR
jgi:serine/threonine protein kinase